MALPFEIPHEAAGLDLILEGFLLHHGQARHLTPSGPGREVLAGDYCYAHGLVRITGAGDLFVVEALADLIALGAGLEKLSVQMTVDQQAAKALFESLGFKAEALLRDHVCDVDGRKHDIVVLGHNVAQVRAQMEAYGLPGAVQH